MRRTQPRAAGFVFSPVALAPVALALVAFAPVPGIALVPANAVAAAVNVRDFGARGDGVSNDARAIQNAIDAVPRGGGVVSIPPGRYVLGPGGALDSGQKYRGDAGPFAHAPILTMLLVRGDRVTIEGSGPSTVLALAANQKARVVTVNGSGVVLRNLAIDGNKHHRDAGSGWPTGDVVDALLVFNRARDGVIANCAIGNAIEGAVGFWLSQGGVVEHCRNHDNGTPAAGGAGIGISGGRDIAVRRNTLRDNSVGVWISFGAGRVAVDDNVIAGNAKGGVVVGSKIAAPYEREISIAGNTITGNGSSGGAGILVYSADQGRIVGNAVNDNRIGVEITGNGGDPATDWRVEGNECSNTNASRTQLHGILVRGWSRNITLIGNSCRDNGSGAADQIVVEPSAAVNPDWRVVNSLSHVERGR